MEPNYSDDDYVITNNWLSVKPNDVVVLEYDNRFIIKRVEKIDELNVLVAGDNRDRTKIIRPILSDDKKREIANGRKAFQD